MSALETTTAKNRFRKHIINMNDKTRKELTLIAKAENVPYSGLNKAALIDRIQHYREPTKWSKFQNTMTSFADNFFERTGRHF